MLQHGLDKHVVDKEANKWQSVVDQTGQTLQAGQLICSREYLSVDMDAYLEARMYVTEKLAIDFVRIFQRILALTHLLWNASF